MNKKATMLDLGFPGGSDGKESACNAGDLGLIYGLGRPPGGGKGYPLQYSGRENSMDSVVHGALRRHFLTIQDEKLRSLPRTVEHSPFPVLNGGKYGIYETYNAIIS